MIDNERISVRSKPWHNYVYKIKALKTLVWHLSREPMKEMNTFKKIDK